MSQHPTVITLDMSAPEPFPAGATLSLLQRETGAWEETIDDTARRMIAQALDDTDNNQDTGGLWVTLFTEQRYETAAIPRFTRYVGWIVAVTDGSDGPSFHFADGEKIPAVHIAGVHL